VISEFEQNLLLGVAAITLAGTLVVFVWQWMRNRGRDED
jgi:hypothetical protein